MNHLDELAIKCNTDKSSLHHGYTKYYKEIISNLEVINKILEIGVGGKTYKGAFGASIKMWNMLLPNSEIVGIDSDPVCAQLSSGNTKIYIGDQSDHALRDRISNIYGKTFDLIIDDASHNNLLTKKTFYLYFSLLKPGGYYVIEDTHCSYESKFGNVRSEFNEFILKLISHIDTDGKMLTKEYAQNFNLLNTDSLSYFERWIEEVRIFRGMLLVKKRAK